MIIIKNHYIKMIKGKLKIIGNTALINPFFDELNHISNVHVLHNNAYEDKQIFAAGITQSFEYYPSKTKNKQSLFKRNSENKEKLMYELNHLNLT